jgi:hypothetical protein
VKIQNEVTEMETRYKALTKQQEEMQKEQDEKLLASAEGLKKI